MTMAISRYTLVLLLLGAVVAAATKDLLYQKSGKNYGSRLGIYSGQPTTIKKHPYLVAILYDDLFNCAGSIISKKWVITTGACNIGVSASEFSVLAGTQDSFTGGTTYRVKEVVIHPDYDCDSMDYNYALLKIEGKFKWSDTIKSVKLPTEAAKVGSEAVIVGWGSTKREENTLLKQGHQSVLNLTECAEIYDGYGLNFTDRFICTYNKGKASACGGDWADPITVENVLHSMFIAINVNGECTKNAWPTIGANVQAAVPWIKTITGITDF